MKPGPPPLAAMKPTAAQHSQRTRRTTKVHEDCQCGGTADVSSLCSKDLRWFTDWLQIKGVLPHAGRGREAWKFGCTASSVARLRALLYLMNLLHLLCAPECGGLAPTASRTGTSLGRAGGAGRTSPCRGVGQRPTPPSTLHPSPPSPFIPPPSPFPSFPFPLSSPSFHPPSFSFLLFSFPSCVFVVLRGFRVFPGNPRSDPPAHGLFSPWAKKHLRRDPGIWYLMGRSAGVIQWQNRSFPCFLRGFDSLRPLHTPSGC